MDDNESLDSLLNEYKIDKDKYLNCISNFYYDRENVIEKDIDISNLICPICYNILKQPRFCSTNNNSHLYCKECIDKYLEINNKCPICKNKFENKSRNEIENELHKLKFKCVFYKEGCNKVVNYLEYFNHIYSCKFKNLIYECKIEKYNYLKKEFEECNYKGNKEEIKEHLKRCGLMKYKCIFCCKNILKIDLKEHFENKCKLRIFKYINNDKYIGENKNKIREGYGIYYYSDGDKYEGDWKNDIKDGYGICYYSNGNKYEGHWKNDIKDGYGIYYFSNGDKYEGEWKNGINDGYGLFYFYPINWKYKGKWKKGIPYGFGTLYSSKGLKYLRNWNIISKFRWFVKSILLILYFFAYLCKINNKTIILILFLILINYYY